MLSYNAGTPSTLPVVNPNEKKGVDNVVKIIGSIAGLGNAAANVWSAAKGTGVAPQAGNAYGGLGSGSMSEGFELNEVVVNAPSSGKPLLSAGVEHSFDTKPLLLLGALGLGAFLLTRK